MIKEKLKNTFFYSFYGLIRKTVLPKKESEISKKDIKSFLRKEDPLILEIGANNGNDSLEFLDEFKKIKLHCFEPDPRQIKNFKLRINDKRCKLHKVALSDKKGSSSFYISESKDPNRTANDSSSLKKPKKHLEKFPWVKFEKEIKIKTETLDSWTEKEKISLIDFIWADVQGAEKELIRGGLKTLNKKVKYFYTEFYNEEFYEGQISLKKILQMLPGFEIVKIYGNNVLLRNKNFGVEEYVISCAQGGLSNRIKCLLSSIEISKRTGRKLLIYWPKIPSCNSNFSDLFKNSFEEIGSRDISKILGNKSLFSFNDYNSTKKFLFIDETNFGAFSKGDILLKFEKISEEVRKRISENLKILKPKREISSKANSFFKKLGREVIGIHIRRGDFLNLKDGIGKVSPLEVFINKIYEESNNHNNCNFFISTDDVEVIVTLREKFGKKVNFYPKKSKKREENGAVEEAFIEMLILSRCKKIIGTYGSTFSEIAWFFGSCNPQIKVAVDKDELHKYQLSLSKTYHFYNLFKKFIYNLFNPPKKRFFKI